MYTWQKSWLITHSTYINKQKKAQKDRGRQLLPIVGSWYAHQMWRSRLDPIWGSEVTTESLRQFGLPKLITDRYCVYSIVQGLLAKSLLPKYISTKAVIYKYSVK